MSRPGNLFNVNVWAFCWPPALILLGVLILIRPQMVRRDLPIRFKPLANFHRRGAWQVSDEEFGIAERT